MKGSMYLRTIIFGISDSLVSTVGLLAGIDLSGVTRQEVILTGIVYAFVEAFSMAVGNFLSEESGEEYEQKGAVSARTSFVAGTTMFVAFILASFIPIAPYLFIFSWQALMVSIVLSILALFIVGLVSARFAKLPMVSRGIRMALLGGAAIVVGALVSSVVKGS